MEKEELRNVLNNSVKPSYRVKWGLLGQSASFDSISSADSFAQSLAPRRNPHTWGVDVHSKEWLLF